MNAELKPIESIGQLTVQERAVVVFKSAKTAEELKALAAASVTITAITNSDGLEQVKRARITLKNARLEVERIGEDGRADAVAVSKAIISQQKALVGLVKPEEDRLQSLQDEWDAKIEAERQARIDAEIARVNAIKERIEELRGCQTLTPASGSDLIGQHIADLQAIAVDESFAEFADQASNVKAATVQRLTALFDAAFEHEAAQRKLADERAELSRLREEAAERDRLAAEERAKQEALDKAQREAEVAAQEKAREKAEAEAKAIRDAEESRLAAERVENARLAKEARALIERQEKEAHERQVEAARAHAQQLAAERAEADRIAAARQAELDAQAAQIAAERAAVEREREALVPKPEPIEDDSPTVTVPTIPEVTGTLEPVGEFPGDEPALEPMKFATLPPGWWLWFNENAGESGLILTGPDGQGAAFPVELGGARATVLQNLLADIAEETT